MPRTLKQEVPTSPANAELTNVIVSYSDSPDNTEKHEIVYGQLHIVLANKEAAKQLVKMVREAGSFKYAMIDDVLQLN
jgi:hypothetical protein